MKQVTYQQQLKEFLLLSLDQCMKAVGARSGSIFLVDEQSKELVLEIVKSANRKETKLEGMRARLGERIAGRVALERKPFLVEDIDNEPSLKYTPKYDHYQSKSFLSVPLECAGHLFGVMNVTDKGSGIPFSGKDLDVITEISNHVGIALRTLRSYSQAQTQIQEQFSRERKHLTEVLNRSQKFSSLGKLVGGIVHEINNPLDGVIRYVNLANDCMKDDGVVKEYLQESKNGLQRIAKIVRSLLDFSWSLSAAEGAIDINHTIDESIFALNHFIISHSITVQKNCATDIPHIPDYRLKLAFTNIIKNACEAMKKGGTLSVATRRRGDIIEIVFADTGPGIPPDIKHSIFEPFFTTKGMGEGSGLGLAISYEIVHRYQGEILVESSSKDGTGARFLIRIPMLEPQQPKA